MSEGLNKVILLGNLGAQPELRFGQSGAAVLNMRLATTEKYKDSSGELKERTDWHNVVVFGKRAEGLSKVLDKGSSLLVEGRLQTSSYEAQDGTKRYKTDVIAVNVLLTGGRPRGGETGDGAGAPPQRGGGQRSGGGGGYGGSGSGRTAGRNQSPPPDDFGDTGGNMDDIPFASSSMSHDLRRCGL
jgi:single-strand DNA-binding protein